MSAHGQQSGPERKSTGGERIFPGLRKMGQDGLRGGGRNRSTTNMGLNVIATADLAAVRVLSGRSPH